jgi:hypothetical protein
MEERNEIKHVVEALNKIMIAIQSLNPDPLQTIGEYRKEKRFDKALAVIAIVLSVMALGISISK